MEGFKPIKKTSLRRGDPSTPLRSAQDDRVGMKDYTRHMGSITKPAGGDPSTRSFHSLAQDDILDATSKLKRWYCHSAPDRCGGGDPSTPLRSAQDDIQNVLNKLNYTIN